MTTDITVISLLDSTSVQQCEKLAKNVDLPGKRAKALLVLNNGESNKAAAEKSGLTSGQVSYVLSRFNKVGMELFNASSTKKAAVKIIVTKKVAAKKAKPAADNDDANKDIASAPVKAKDKKKKSKKIPKKDNAKKESKKDKKGKKSGKKGKSKK